MEPVAHVAVRCPYCGERIDLCVDLSVAAQRYVEDCAVCCRPLDVTVERDAGADGTPGVRVGREDD